MPSDDSATPLVVIAGPTGSGKSELGLSIAEAFPGEIINCDSVQIYRHLNIGSAKLSVPERKGIPHHLLDIADPDETYSAGEYARQARQALHDIAVGNRLPIVVGGTGFYIRALIDGLFAGPSRDDALRDRLVKRESGKPGSLHRILSRLDPATAARIHLNDTNKLIRALEVCLLTRKPLSELYSQGRQPLLGFRPIKIGLNPPREKLYERLDLRSKRIFDQGLVEEVKQILSLGFSPNCKPFESLGYRQALLVLHGELTVDEAIELTQRDTRRYAKRQLTWFRREPDMEWFSGFGDDENTQLMVIKRVKQHLGGIAGSRLLD